MNDVKVTLSMSQTFIESSNKLTQAIGGKVWDTINKFKTNPRSTGLNLEKIGNNLMSIRVDQTYRIILSKVDKGLSYLLLWVDHHDDAYQWASKHRVDVQHDIIQIYEADKHNLAVKDDIGLFSSVSEYDLLRLGVPDTLMGYIRSIENESDLEKAGHDLNKRLHESLVYLSSGIPIQEILDLMKEYNELSPTKNLSDDSILLSPENQQSYVVLNPEFDSSSFHEMINQPLQSWRHFLHPTQRLIVEQDYSGPVKVLGGAGTGKTVVAIHRAKYLAESIYNLPTNKILLTTFTTNLADDIRDQLQAICAPLAFRQIEIMNLDKVLAKLLLHYEESFHVMYDFEKIQSYWANAKDQEQYLGNLSERFFMDEWSRVILPQDITDVKEYFTADRRGRGTRLNREDKIVVWNIIRAFRKLCNENKCYDIDYAFYFITKKLLSGKVQQPYSSVVVDEAQDFDQLRLSFIRALAGPQHCNDLFIIGDAHQRIYQKVSILSRSGITVGHRSYTLKINYRTTDQIRTWAMKLFSGEKIDDLNEGIDNNYGYISLMSGPDPLSLCFETREEEFDAVESVLIDLASSTGSTDVWRNICITFRSRNLLSQYKNELQKRGIDTYEIKGSQNDDSERSGVRLATMHRVKGLEFDHMIVCAVNHTVIPNSTTLDAAIDLVARREALSAERNLLFVAATRAKKTLHVFSHGEKSMFLKD